MAEVKITLETKASLLGVFLHHPGTSPPEPLPGVAHTVTRSLPQGIYHLAISGTGLAAGTVVKIVFEAGGGKTTKSRSVRPDGTIGVLIPFEVTAGGGVQC
jgi:hypothetical protein